MRSKHKHLTCESMNTWCVLHPYDFNDVIFKFNYHSWKIISIYTSNKYQLRRKMIIFFRKNLSLICSNANHLIKNMSGNQNLINCNYQRILRASMQMQRMKAYRKRNFYGNLCNSVNNSKQLKSNLPMSSNRKRREYY